jgi:mRNA-degrading endonuclease HigB of HigAB toxin-antitoxin module
LQRTLRQFEDSLRNRLDEVAIREASIDEIIAVKERQILERYENKEKELKLLHKQLDEKISAWNKMKELKMLFGPVVRMNVGGVVFQTSLQTVRKVRKINFLFNAGHNLLHRS